MKFALFLLLLVSFDANAKPKPSPRPSPSASVNLKKLAPPAIDQRAGGGGAEDMLSQTKIPEAISEKKDGPEVKITTSCTDARGNIFDQDSAGYQNCIETKANLHR